MKRLGFTAIFLSVFLISSANGEGVFSSYSSMYQCLKGLSAGGAIPKSDTPNASRSNDVFAILDGSDFYVLTPQMMYKGPFEFTDMDTEVVDGRRQIVDVTRTRTYSSANRCREGIVNGTLIHRFRFSGGRGMDPRPGPWDFRLTSSADSRGTADFRPNGFTDEVGPQASGDGYCGATLQESMGSQDVDNSMLAVILNGFVQHGYPSKAIEKAEERRQQYAREAKERNEDMQLLNRGEERFQAAGNQIRNTLSACIETGNEAVAGYARTALQSLNQDPRFRVGTGGGPPGPGDEGAN